MNTAIVFASVHGTSEKCARKLASVLKGNITIINLDSDKELDLSVYSAVIIGSSIHMGELNPKTKKFIEQNRFVLEKKYLGFFLCFLSPCSKGDEYLQKSLSPEFYQKIKVKGYFGGELDFDKMNAFEKQIIGKTVCVSHSLSKIKEDEIIRFANQMNRLITAN